MRQALLVANESLRAAGFVGDELERRGYTFTVVPREGDDWPGLDDAPGPHGSELPNGWELIVSLGSDWHVYDPARAGALAMEAALLRGAHERGIPVLGICFGAQMLSHALGGRVLRATEPEIGWLEVEPLVPEIPAGPWMQWHADTFTLPEGATLLARSPVGPQSFRVGRSVGLQFHPEVDTAIVVDWIAGDGERELADAGVDAKELVTRTEQEVARSEGAARALVDWFCRVVAAA